MHESREPGSNVTIERNVHRAKQLLQSFSTEAGTDIEQSDEQYRNTEGPIRESWE
jgi:hypothetical protein